METFTKTIETWYGTHKRNLPWRDIKDPYKIWVSEIILQQTRVAQGYEYYLRFIRRFPTVATLAEAEEQEVLKYWQGLGYYSRARNLHTAARQVMDNGGVFPQTYKQVRALKGIGDYTAAAICSFAFGLPQAVLDGNVYRVLSRYFEVDTPIDTVQGKKTFTSLAQSMLDTGNPGLYNQAIMDFGAIQCTPQNPECMYCPLRDSCAAYHAGKTLDLPVKSRKTLVKDCYFTYLYISYKRFTVLHQRAGKGIWRNMYELPLVISDSAKAQKAFFSSEGCAQWMSTALDSFTVRPVAEQVKHVLSHRIIHANCYALLFQDNAFPCEEAFRLWAENRHCIAVEKEGIAPYPLPRLVSLMIEKAESLEESK